MDWRRATEDDAAALGELSEAFPSEGQARSFLGTWRVDLAVERGTAAAAVALLPPSSGHHRGYGALWDDGADSPERFGEIVARLKILAAAIPGVEVLQVTKPSADAGMRARLEAAGFRAAYPVWTMTHDGVTWPDGPGRLPDPLHPAGWADVDLSGFHEAYSHAYQDQRLVEPHSADTWSQLTADDESFAQDLASLAVTPQGHVAGYVLGFRSNNGGFDLGPVGTVPAWRRRGVSSALLSSVLLLCRDQGITPITLTSDGDSPTGAQRLYERLGFERSETLTAFQLAVA